MSKIRLYKVLGSLIIFALSYAAFLWLFETNSGLQFAYQFGKNFLPGKLQVNGLSGSLAGPIKMETINYQQNQLKLSAHSIQFDWRLRDLLFKKATITSLNANNIEIIIPNETRKTFIFPNLLIFDLQNIKLQKIKVIHPQLPKPSNIDSLQLSILSSSQRLNFIDLKLTSANNNIQINGRFNRQYYDVNWDINLKHLNHLTSTLSGTIDSQGKLSGKRLASLNANVILHANELQVLNHKIAKLNAKFITDTAQTNITHIDLSLNNIQSPKYMIESLATKGNLTLNDHLTTTLSLHVLPIKLAKQPVIDNIVLKATRNGNKIFSEFSITPIDQSAIIGKLNINNSSLTGTLDWHTQSLKLLEAFFSGIKNPEGKLEALFTLKGTIKNPEWSGKLNLQQVKANIPIANLQLTDGHLQVDVAPKEIKYNGQISSGSNLNIEGITKLSANRLFTEIRLAGNNFLLSNTPSVYLLVSPDIKLTADNQRIDLNGTIIIPKAHVELQDLSETETLPQDVKFVGQAQPTTFTSLIMDLYSHITITLGNEAYLNMQGLKGSISGKVLIDGNPQRNTIGNGTLTLKDGSYNLYGQTLKVGQGYLIFSNSPITNPNLNIRASRDIRNIGSDGLLGLNGEVFSVGIDIRGTVNNPLSTLYSEPKGLSQEDILSYLLLGQASMQISDAYGDTAKLDNQINLMLNAIKMLNIGGSGNKFTALSDSLRNKLGFTEFGLTTTNSAGVKSTPSVTTALTLGRYLSPTLYVGYSIGILDQVSTFRIRYKLWKNFILQTETSTLDMGIDLLYSMARD
jgi:translocation and assembly module TamB